MPGTRLGINNQIKLKDNRWESALSYKSLFERSFVFRYIVHAWEEFRLVPAARLARIHPQPPHRSTAAEEKSAFIVSG